MAPNINVPNGSKKTKYMKIKFYYLKMFIKLTRSTDKHSGFVAGARFTVDDLCSLEPMCKFFVAILQPVLRNTSRCDPLQ